MLVCVVSLRLFYEASKYIFYLKYESGHVYKPSQRDFVLELKNVVPAEAERLRSIWSYWSQESEELDDSAENEEFVHPDHMLPR